MTHPLDEPHMGDYPGQTIARALRWPDGTPMMLREEWDLLSRRRRLWDTLRGRRPLDFRPEHMRPPRRRFFSWD